jgi:hypothetical protein
MLTLDRIEPARLVARTTDVTLRCIVCHHGFAFEAGETALILKHVA